MRKTVWRIPIGDSFNLDVRKYILDTASPAQRRWMLRNCFEWNIEYLEHQQSNCIVVDIIANKPNDCVIADLLWN